VNKIRTVVVTIGALGLLGAGFGTAEAVAASGIALAIPDSSGVIHGCYSKTSGALKVIDTTKTTACLSGYTHLNWNQYGGDQAIEVSKSIFVSDSDTNTQEIVEATCPAGYIGTGGGFAALWDATAEQWRLDVSAPGEANPPPGWNLSDGSNSWEVLFDRTGPVGTGAGSTQVAAYVNCSPSHDLGATGP
jgi:hypothetical protein